MQRMRQVVNHLFWHAAGVVVDQLVHRVSVYLGTLASVARVVHDNPFGDGMFDHTTSRLCSTVRFLGQNHGVDHVNDPVAAFDVRRDDVGIVHHHAAIRFRNRNR